MPCIKATSHLTCYLSKDFSLPFVECQAWSLCQYALSPAYVELCLLTCRSLFVLLSNSSDCGMLCQFVRCLDVGLLYACISTESSLDCRQVLSSSLQAGISPTGQLVIQAMSHTWLVMRVLGWTPTTGCLSYSSSIGWSASFSRSWFLSWVERAKSILMKYGYILRIVAMQLLEGLRACNNNFYFIQISTHALQYLWATARQTENCASASHRMHLFTTRGLQSGSLLIRWLIACRQACVWIAFVPLPLYEKYECHTQFLSQDQCSMIKENLLKLGSKLYGSNKRHLPIGLVKGRELQVSSLSHLHAVARLLQPSLWDKAVDE